MIYNNFINIHILILFLIDLSFMSRSINIRVIVLFLYLPFHVALFVGLKLSIFSITWAKFGNLKVLFKEFIFISNFFYSIFKPYIYYKEFKVHA